MAEKNLKMKIPDLPSGIGDFRFIYFSELAGKPICIGKIKNRIGKLTDIVFAVKDLYPEAVGAYIEHGWGKPTEFIPWQKVLRIETDAIFVHAPESGEKYPPFIDQPGWILLDNHLMGRTIVDMDDRRVEVVNDVHLLEAKGRLLLVHVDISFNGFLRRLGLGKFRWIKEDLISWKYVQPLSVEDAISTDKVSLSVTRNQIRKLPSEDLADILEELSGKEQQALFSALDSEKAAETLVEAEPRAKRQIIANLRKERAHNIFSEMTTPQLAALFSVLPHDHSTGLMELLTKDQAERIEAILSKGEVRVGEIMSFKFIAMRKDTRVGSALEKIRSSDVEPENISYIYVVNDDNTLVGVIDIRNLVLSADDVLLSSIMVPPVVTAEKDDMQEDLAEMFAKYNYRMIPVVDGRGGIIGVVYSDDVQER